jgi:hypothetical protein
MARSRDGARQRIAVTPGRVLLAGALAVLVLAFLFFRTMESQGRQIGTLQAQSSALAGGLQTAESQLEAHGITPSVAAPSEIISQVAGPSGPGPSDSQVQAAVNAYLDAHPPTANVDPAALSLTVDAYLEQHPPSPGPPPASSAVAAAVADYLASNPPPSGPAGPQGSPGADGVGQTGPAGPAGPSGAPGSPPAGWTWEDPQGNTYDCTEDDGTPAPHYTCALVTPSSTATSTTPAPTTSAPTGTASTAAFATDKTGSGSTTPAGSTAPTTPPPTPSGQPLISLPALPIAQKRDLVRGALMAIGVYGYPYPA